ncbi:Hypothetical protein PBC10988_22990 [Planctomycetales bacterium 10988]|nr:Hypothetical protein PBC10988_22990 [Planctomycetales bacterium 10988]
MNVPSNQPLPLVIKRGVSFLCQGLLLLSLFAMPAVAQADQTRQETLEQLGDAVVIVRALGSEPNQVLGYGTGFVLNKDEKTLVTNYHVVAQAEAITVHFRDDTLAKVVGYRAYDPHADLVVLEIDRLPSFAKSLALATPKEVIQGANVLTMGHPKGFRFAVSSGIVSALHRTEQLPKYARVGLRAKDKQLWVQTSAPISSGNSGGPLVDAEGRVLGVVTWMSAQGQNLGFAIHVRHLHEMLQGKSKKALAWKRIQDKTYASTFPSMQPKITHPEAVTSPSEPKTHAVAKPILSESATNSPGVKPEELRHLIAAADRRNWQINSRDDLEVLSNLGIAVTLLSHPEGVQLETESLKRRIPLLSWSVEEEAKTLNAWTLEKWENTETASLRGVCCWATYLGMEEENEQGVRTAILQLKHTRNLLGVAYSEAQLVENLEPGSDYILLGILVTSKPIAVKTSGSDAVAKAPFAMVATGLILPAPSK